MVGNPQQITAYIFPRGVCTFPFLVLLLLLLLVLTGGEKKRTRKRSISETSGLTNTLGSEETAHIIPFYFGDAQEILRVDESPFFRVLVLGLGAAQRHAAQREIILL